MHAHTVIGSALGCLTLVAEQDAIVGMHMDLQRHRPDDRELGEPDPAAGLNRSRLRPPA
jgi:methylated-DNA-[protein]-cysteine S-methyltransferase